MNASVWKTPEGTWAVCDGPGPTGVKGYIVERSGGGWTVENDPSGTRYADMESAASHVLGAELKGTLDYIIAKDGQARTLRTYPEVIETLKKQGYSTVVKQRS